MRKAFVLTAALLLAGCVHHPDALTLRLAFTPTDNPRDLPAPAIYALSRRPLSVQVVADQRPPPPYQIGVNVEDRVPRPVSTPDDVDGFIRYCLEQSLAADGVPLVPVGGERVLQLRVLSFFVQEANTYAAKVSFAASFTDRAGRVLWQGPMAGSSNRWGRSFAPDNYREALSNATLDALKNLLSTPEFLLAAGG